jgi:glycosyltransferase involved in cell wall biosynthesis
MKVSVVIPVYNAQAFVDQAVYSALAQDETAEVILAEDGSTDGSLDICKRLAESLPRVHLVRHSDRLNHGAGASRNLGIRNTTQDIIAFLDADDYYLPGRFQTARRLFRSDPTIDGVYEATGIHFESESAKEGWTNSPIFRGELITTIPTGIPPHRLFEELVLHGACFTTDAIVFKKSLLLKTGLFDEDLPLHQDTAMWIKMSAVGCLISGSIDRPVAVRRVHDGNRITKLRAGYSPDREKLDDVLCGWAEMADLPKGHLQMLYYRRWLNRFFNYDQIMRANLRTNNCTPQIRRLRKAMFLIRRITTKPSLVFSKFFLRFVRSSLSNTFGHI